MPDLEEVLARVAWSDPDEVLLMRDIPLDRRHQAKVDHPTLLAMVARGQWQARVPALCPAHTRDRNAAAVSALLPRSVRYASRHAHLSRTASD
jgi:hypothetical protein